MVPDLRILGTTVSAFKHIKSILHYLAISSGTSSNKYLEEPVKNLQILNISYDTRLKGTKYNH